MISDEIKLFDIYFKKRINKIKFNIYLNHSPSNKKYYTITYKSKTGILGNYSSLYKTFSIQMNVCEKISREYYSGNINPIRMKRIVSIILKKEIDEIKIYNF